MREKVAELEYRNDCLQQELRETQRERDDLAERLANMTHAASSAADTAMKALERLQRSEVIVACARNWYETGDDEQELAELMAIDAEEREARS